ncbi:MAG: S-methyl-5'-thioinosine phosphorylase [Pseudomonadales bacterium]|nr:S-methyl-5'-thioinosine phosphorylase [Pseudomonadales bacterium]
MLAIIGGTGFAEFTAIENPLTKQVPTKYGPVHLMTGVLHGQSIVFLSRHGHPPRTPPHSINYRANIQALNLLGVERIISVNAVGSVDRSLAVGDLVFPDQIIDYTSNRPVSFFDDEIEHIDFTYPYTESLRQTLITCANKIVDPKIVQSSGVYGCTQGPRLETAAEVRRLGVDGCTVVGMTAMPEAALAREKAMQYAGISVVVNFGAGINDQAIDLGSIQAVLDTGMNQVASIIQLFVSDLKAD